jgi:hypothetical protein
VCLNAKKDCQIGLLEVVRAAGRRKASGTLPLGFRGTSQNAVIHFNPAGVWGMSV